MKRKLQETLKGPLRKIVSTERYLIHKSNDTKLETWGTLEVLECGHKVTVKQDIYGSTNAYRRRCRKCQKET